MGKYTPLTEFLAARRGRRITMSFSEIEQVVGAPLPNSKRIRAWWSNNSDNNVMTVAWLAAGFKSADVDIEQERLTFVPAGLPSEGSKGPVMGHPARGSLKGTVTWPAGTDLTEPLGVDWEAEQGGAAA